MTSASGPILKPFRDANPLLLASLLAAITIAAFARSFWNGFVNYDDPVYVYANPHVLGGFTWENVRWAFSSFERGFWHPPTWLSIMADCQLFGKTAWGHHLTSVALHTATSVLLFILLRRMTERGWRSFFVAAFFAVHPLHVESVAWAAERKDVLSAFFFVLTLFAYVIYVQSPKSKVPGPRSQVQSPKFTVSGLWYYAALVFFTLGLMSKTMIVTVPFVLLLLDFWPLGRVSRVECRGSWPHKARTTRTFTWILAEKLPFLLLAIAAGIVTILAQKESGAIQTAAKFGALQRVENAIHSYAEYLLQAFWPTRLAVFYSFQKSFSIWVTVGWLFLGCAITVAAVWMIGPIRHTGLIGDSRPGRCYPWFLFGWAWYLITLLPVIGLFQVGSQAHADRYTYIPLIGIFVIVVWGVAELLDRAPLVQTASQEAEARQSPAQVYSPRPLWPAATVGAVSLAACIGLTTRQIGFWKDSETLFRHALRVTQDNEVAHNMLATTLSSKALSLRRDLARTTDAAQQKELRVQIESADEEAISEYKQAVLLAPDYTLAQGNLGAILLRKGRLQESIEHSEAAIKQMPGFAGAHRNLGEALRQAGRTDEALAQLQFALKLAPTDPEAHYYLGLALLSTGQTNMAMQHIQSAMALQQRAKP